MNHLRRLLLISIAIVTLAIPAAAEAAMPAGSVLRPGAQTKAWGVIKCGLYGVGWRAGTVLPRSYFVSHAQQSANFTRLARRSTGLAARRYKTLAARFALRAKQQAATCRIPRGAYLVTSSTQVVLRNGIWCQSTGAIPGMKFGMRFITHAAHATEYNRLRLATRGTQQSQLRTLYMKFIGLARSQKSLCAVPPVLTPLRFNIASAAAIASRPATTGVALMRRASVKSTDPQPDIVAEGTGSNLTALEPDGTSHDAVSQGSAVVSKFLSAPNGKLYVLFQKRVDLANSTATWSPSGCLLAEVEQASGVPTCVDNSLSWINWGMFGGSTYPNAPIQFDAAGAVYYLGTLSDATGIRTVLRRYLNGATSDLITDYISIDDFLVQPDGTVYISGRTSTSMISWVRRRYPAGGINTLLNSTSSFMRVFPDGRIYMSNGMSNVLAYDGAAAAFASVPWISGEATATNPTSTICGEGLSGPSQFCMNGGGLVAGMHVIGSEAWAISGGRGDGALVRYYPSLEAPSTGLKQITVSESAGSKIVLAGLDNDNRHVLKLFNVTTDSLTELVSAANQLEVYHLDHDPSANRIIFDGQRFSDGAYVFGSIDLSTDTVSITGSAGQKWDDFQALM